MESESTSESLDHPFFASLYVCDRPPFRCQPCWFDEISVGTL